MENIKKPLLVNRDEMITDSQYIAWLKELKQRYAMTQVKAALHVNEGMLLFYWSLGKDILQMKAESKWGNVQVRQGAGTFVAEASDANGGSINMSIADRTELDEVRKILDTAIVEKAVARRTEKDIERMQSSLEARKANAKDGLLKECIEVDMNFHIAIADATHNRILADIYRSASLHLLSEFNRIYDGTDCFINSQSSHEKLLRYIIAGDLKNARKMATRIVEEA